ncbi:MAG: DUF4388 domain-containing protein [bacterium]|nr:DUF4388 domain-containing protein [bacterium]
MTKYFPLDGELKEGEIFTILYHIYKNSISGLLKVKTDNYEKKIVIEDKKVVFAISNIQSDAFGDHLLKNHVIDKVTYNEISRHMEIHNTRFGRSLIERGYLNYEQIWHWVLDHLKTIVYSFFKIKHGEYTVSVDHDSDIENIVLDIDLINLIVDGMREFKSKKFLESKFEDIEHLYSCNSKMLLQLDLKPYEMHIFDLVRRSSSLEDIKKCSELLEFDTLRLLYMFLVLEVISTKPDTHTHELEEDPPAEENIARLSTFSSFDEALKHYNLRFELIYKTISKEIGPIAHSLLLKAIEDIMENLPFFLQKMQLNSDGRIDDEALLKTLWYHDFDKNCGEFLRGLEEVLYTEIYAVKKHLGMEYEQQVLKWISGIGS